ncbi:MAG: methyltransferase domain-containing protein [Pseudomonadota bacterium]
MPANQTYAHEGSSSAVEFFGTRTADVQAAFLLPLIAPEADVLDCGCGPGSITAGLARHAARGRAVGVDIEAAQIEKANAMATSEGLANLSFQTGDLFALPFDDASFEVVYSNGVLSHLSDPVSALAEMRRVLRPGGVAGVRLLDGGADVRHPIGSAVTRCQEIYYAIVEHHGGDLLMARRQKAMMQQAGFARAEMTGACEYYGSPQATRAWAGLFDGLFGESDLARQIVEAGISDRAELERLRGEITDWGSSSEAFYAQVWTQAIGYA